MGPEKGRSRSLTLTQYFLLILSKLFCLFVCFFKLTIWKKCLGYLWFSCPFPAPPRLEWGN